MSDDLSRAMRATAENLTPNIGKLTAGGVERGVRRRRARRISQITGAAASVTAVFGVVAAVGSFGSGPDAAAVSTAAGNPAAVAATSSAPAPGAAKAPAPTASAPTSSAALGSKHPGLDPTSAPSAAPVSGEEVVKLLKESLAAYHFDPETVMNKAGTEQMGGAFAVLKVGNAAGTGNVSVTISRSPWASVGLGNSPIPYITVKNLEDGSHLMIFDGPEWPQGNGDPTAKRLDVGWYRNDGVLISVEALNQATEKGATTASAVPLTVEQATAIAKSPAWNPAAAAAAYQAWVDFQNRPTGNAADTKAKGGNVPASDAAKPAQTSAH